MPRRQTDLDFLKNRLRVLLRRRDVPAATYLRGVLVLGALSGLLEATFKDRDEKSGDTSTETPKAVQQFNDTLDAALRVARDMARRKDGDKLPTGQ